MQNVFWLQIGQSWSSVHICGQDLKTSFWVLQLNQQKKNIPVFVLIFVMAHAGSTLNFVLHDTHRFEIERRILVLQDCDIPAGCTIPRHWWEISGSNKFYFFLVSIYQTPSSSNNPLHDWYVHLHTADNALGITTVSWIFNQHSLSHKLLLFSRTWMITVTVSVDLRTELVFFLQLTCPWPNAPSLTGRVTHLITLRLQGGK